MAATRSQRVIAIAGVAVAATVVVVFLSRQEFSIQQTAEAIQNAVRDHPIAGPFIFIAAYAVAAVVLIPGTVCIPLSLCILSLTAIRVWITNCRYVRILRMCSVLVDFGCWLPLRSDPRHGNCFGCGDAGSDAGFLRVALRGQAAGLGPPRLQPTLPADLR